MEEVKRNPDYHLDDLSSEFDYQSEAERKNRKRKKDDLWEKEYPGEEPKPSRSQAKSFFQEEHRKFTRRISRLQTMDAYSRHKEMINLYHLTHPGAADSLLKRDTSKDRTDFDVLKDNHKFVWSDEELLNAETNWESRMAKKYYDKLFKEYVIVDLSRYEKNQIAMRWRTEHEVKSGKGQFICGNKKCAVDYDLTSWEVNFRYKEKGEDKATLVKVRLCPECSAKLNYGSQKRKFTRQPKEKKKRKEKYEILEKKSKNKDENVEEEEQKKEKAEADKEKAAASEVWTQPAEQEVERTVDEDIDEFLNELFC